MAILAMSAAIAELLALEMLRPYFWFILATIHCEKAENTSPATYLRMTTPQMNFGCTSGASSAGAAWLQAGRGSGISDAIRTASSAFLIALPLRRRARTAPRTSGAHR